MKTSVQLVIVAICMFVAACLAFPLTLDMCAREHISYMWTGMPSAVLVLIGCVALYAAEDYASKCD